MPAFAFRRALLPGLLAAAFAAPAALSQAADDRYRPLDRPGDGPGIDIRDADRVDGPDLNTTDRFGSGDRARIERDRANRTAYANEREVERSRSDAFGPGEGSWELTLAGGGSSDKDFENNTVSATVDASYYFSELVAGGVRQSIVASGVGDNNAWSGSTSGFGQLHFGDAKLRPYVGLEVGYLYGDGVNDTFFGGPEAGLKYYVKDEAFIFGRANYQFLFESGDDIDDQFDDGRFVYTFGVGFTF